MPVSEQEEGVAQRSDGADSSRMFNFSAGPAVLPLPVLRQAQSDLLALPGVGSSVLEISHRSAAFDTILEETLATLRHLLSVGEDHELILLQGGASLQFSMIPMNLLRGHGSADYILTGSWGNAALKEALREGDARIVWDGKDKNYSCLPRIEELNVSSDSAYVHLTSNETIQGVQWKQVPDVGDAPLICDCSSDFLSRPIDVSKYGLLYACAQKNAGIAGVTVVVIRKDLLHRCGDALPKMMNYQTYVKNGSRPNTPPVFAVYILGLVCRWIQESMGGLSMLAQQNASKAQLLYDVIDKSDGFYAGHAHASCRSDMNVTFRLGDETREKQFVEKAAEHGLVDLKGHRSVGGIRASIYNAMPLKGVETLRQFMLDFQQSH